MGAFTVVMSLTYLEYSYATIIKFSIFPNVSDMLHANFQTLSIFKYCNIASIELGCSDESDRDIHIYIEISTKNPHTCTYIYTDIHTLARILSCLTDFKVFYIQTLQLPHSSFYRLRLLQNFRTIYLFCFLFCTASMDTCTYSP